MMTMNVTINGVVYVAHGWDDGTIIMVPPTTPNGPGPFVLHAE